MIVGGLILFILLFVWIIRPFGKNALELKKNAVPAVISTNWDDAYDLVSKDANGLYLFNYLLKTRISKGKEVSKIDHSYNLDSISKKSKPSFIFIGERFVLTESESDTLFSKVANGSRLFLAHHQLDASFYDELFDNIELSYDYNFAAKIKSANASFTFYHLYQNDTIANKWRGYKNVLTSTETPHKALSKIGNLENNIAIPYGSGYIYICTNPEVFVNYQLKTNDGIKHAKIWINRIPENENIYWLELGRFVEEDKDIDPWEDDPFEEGEEKVDDSYLQFIFQQKSLIYALILLIVGIIAYVIFRAKRTQPIVPYLPKKKNMTLLFTDTITSIYFANRNPYVMLNLQKRNFYDAVQKHFFIDISRRNENKEIKMLSQKSNISEQEITALINGFETTEVSKVDEAYLVNIGLNLVSFYRRSGLISNKVQDKLAAREFILHRSLKISSLMLILGMSAIQISLYFLIKSIGIGVAFWPIGLFFMVYGFLYMSKPILLVNNLNIKYIPILGKAKIYTLSEIEHIETNNRGAKIIMLNGKKLNINYWELMKSDAEQLKGFVINQNKLKL